MRKCRVVCAVIAALLAIADLAIAQGYGGPSMLSRGGNRPGRRGRSNADIAVYGAIRGTMETGLTPVQLEDDGTLVSQTAYGLQAEIGAYGTHSWRRTIIGLDYRGDYRKTARRNANNYDGTNQVLSFDLQHRLNARTLLVFQENGGTTNRAFGGFAAPAISDSQSLDLVNNEVFDSRSYFSQTMGGIAYRKSARSTYFASSDLFFVRRTDPRLVDSRGFRVNGSYDYRINTGLSVGTVYTYMRYDFPQIFGRSDIQGLSLRINKQFTPNLGLTIVGGAFHLATSGTETVQLSPEIAAILGRTTGVESFARTDLIPQIEATLRYSLERSIFTIGYARTVTPGNGVYLTSQSDTASVGYNYTGIRKLSMGASSYYSRRKSLAIVTGPLSMYRVGTGLSYTLTRHINISSQLDYRTFDSPGVRGREGFALFLGLSVSPARLPLSIW